MCKCSSKVPTHIMKLTTVESKLVLTLLCISQIFLCSVQTVRILCIFTVNFESHHSVFRVIIEELARGGHELVVITSQPRSEPLQNVTEIDVRDSSDGIWEKYYSEAKTRYSDITTDPVTLYGKVVMPVTVETIEKELIAPKVQKLIKDEKQLFDVILMEACKELNLVFSARFRAPVILISSFYGTEHNFATVGAVMHPLLLPYFNMQALTFPTIWESLDALHTYFWIRYYESQTNIIGDTLIRKYFGEKAPTFEELRKRVHLLLLNVHHVWDNNRPVPPSVIYMGALHLKKPKVLPHDLQSYLDSSHNGVVYVSLGSMLRFSDLPPQTLRVFFDVFSSIPCNVLIKWNGDELPNKTANLRLEKWVPQNDLLHHPNIKLFIMQGGMQSTDEAIAAKVPLLALPIYGDQFYNANKCLKHGIGLTLDINTLDENKLHGAILKLIQDKSYRVNVTRLSRIMEEQRAGALQRVMYWVEYTATHGAEHLRSPLADASLREYFLLDFLGLLFLLLTMCVWLFCLFLRLFVSRVVQWTSAALARLFGPGIKTKSSSSPPAINHSLPGSCSPKNMPVKRAGYGESRKKSKKI